MRKEQYRYKNNSDEKERVPRESIKAGSLVFIRKENHAGRKHELSSMADDSFHMQPITDTTIVLRINNTTDLVYLDR